MILNDGVIENLDPRLAFHDRDNHIILRILKVANESLQELSASRGCPHIDDKPAMPKDIHLIDTVLLV